MDRETPPDEAAAQVVRQQLGLTQDQVLVVLMGRINRWKGQALLVEAAQRLRDAGLTQVRYLIVGSAPTGQEHFAADLQRTIERLGVADRVTVMGFRQDIWPIWDACDIAVVPSTEPEPFGMVALEAMAARKPVIAAAHGGLPDIVVDGVTGMLVKPNDATALGDAIASLVRDKARREQLGEAGWQRLGETFSSQHYIKGFEQLYGTVTESRT
jgi:glycosyltransferase involved in cell wall biosynthesis